MTYDDVAEIKLLLVSIEALLKCMLPLLQTTALRLSDIEEDTTVIVRCVSDHLPMKPRPEPK